MSLEQKHEELFSVVAKYSENIENENLQKLKKVFPQFVKDGEVDFDAMQAFLKKEGVLASDEKYGLNWSGKSNAFKAIRTPATGTLIPEKDKSKNWDETENIFIEGDNLEVLKLLQKHYREKIKMIYIDPPYNTGKDFVYKDNFTQGVSDYYEQTGQTKGGIKMTANTEKNGRYHSDWLTMMYPRLFLARNLLKEDGVIFVSIDDNEVANLRMVMDEIFGEENFIGCFIWNKKLTGGYDNDNLNTQHEYVLFYVKSIYDFQVINEEKESKYKLIDENGKKFKWDSLWNVGGLTYSKSLDYPIMSPEGTEIWPIGEKGVSFWLWSKTKVENERDRLKFEKNKNGNWKVYKRIYASDNIVPGSMLDKDIVKGNTHSSSEIKTLFDGNKIFDYAKPTPLIKYLIARGTSDNDLILDFFAGSGTTTHAVMDLNSNDGANRKWISVQLPEITDESGDVYKSGYKTISEISRERIRRAGDKIGKGDIGFKSYKLSNSNYRKWSDISLDDEKELIKQSKLFIESPLIDNFIPENVVYEIALKEGFDLNSKVTQDKGDLKPYVLKDGGRRLFATFSDKVTKDKVVELKLSQDDLFVCFDNAISDTDKVNVGKIINLKVI
jgi:adenine-specific DNA-methyltransferase